MAEGILESVSQELVIFNNNLPTLMDAEFETIEGVFESLEDVNASSMDMMAQTLLRIETILMDVLNIVPAAIMQASDAELDADKLADKKKKRNEDPDNEDGSKFVGAFKKGMEDVGSFEDMLDDILPISALMAGLGAAFGTLTAVILPALPLILGVAAGIGALVYGLMTAFDYFNEKEGTLGDKILAGIEGFFQGILKVVTLPLDLLKDGLSFLATSILGEGNFVSDFLDDFTIFDTLSAILSDFFAFIGDIFDMFSSIVDTVGEFLAPMIERLQPALKGIKAMFSGLSNMIDWFIEMGALALKFLGLTFPESTEPALELTQGEQNAAEKEAKDSGLLEKNIIGDSVVDESMLAGATAEQLQAIVNDDDLSDDQTFMVKNQLDRMMGTGPHTPAVAPEVPEEDTAMLDAIKTVVPPPTPEYEVEYTDQYKLNEFAAQQRKVHRKAEADKIAADKRLAEMGREEAKNPGTVKSAIKEPQPSAAFAELQKEEAEYRANRKKKKEAGTVKTAIKRDPVTGAPLAGQFKAPLGSKGKSFAVYNPFAKQDEIFDDFERASMFADTHMQEVKVVDKPSVAGGGDALAVSQQMTSGTTKMNDGNAQLAQGNSGGSVAINAPTNTTNVQNKNISSSTPSAMDKSDRTISRSRKR